MNAYFDLSSVSEIVDVAAGGLFSTALGAGRDDVDKEGVVVDVWSVVGAAVGKFAETNAGSESCAKEDWGKIIERKRSTEEQRVFERKHRQTPPCRRLESILTMS